MRDRASANTKAVNILSEVLTNSFDGQCLSHTINNAGHAMVHPELTSFMDRLTTMWNQSTAACVAWRERTGKSPVSASKTRWWSELEQMTIVMGSFGDLYPYLLDLKAKNISPAHVKAMLEMMVGSKETVPLCVAGTPSTVRTIPGVEHLIGIQLAAAVDAGTPFAQATYNLETNGANHLIQRTGVCRTDVQFMQD